MSDKLWDVYVYGDVNADIIVPGVREVPPYGQEKIIDVIETFVGGGAALFALGTGKLGLRTVFQGKVGADCYGEFIRASMTAVHVNTSFLQISPNQKTGISISFTDSSDRSFLTYMGTNREVDITEVDMRQAAKARHIHITGYAGKINHEKYVIILKELKKLNDITVSFDVGWDDSGEWYEGIYDLMPYIDIMFMNETEAVHYARTEDARKAVALFAEKGPLTVGKFGKKGAYAVQNKEAYEAKAFQVEAVDTTGAGDSFNAGFIYGYLTGHTITECLKFGNACGAMSVTKLGGNSGFPLRNELHDFMEGKEEQH